MNRDEAIAKLKQHEAELRALGVDHLYLFGSTARDEAREDSDIDLFFDHEKGRLGVYELIDVKECAASILRRTVDIYDAGQLTPCREKADRGLRTARVLMSGRDLSPRLIDIIEAIERIRMILNATTCSL